MASPVVIADRVQIAADMLLQGHGASRVVAELAERQGISKRTARRVVARAYQQLVRDLEDSKIERPMLIAQVVSNLQTAMAQALASEHPSAVVGVARELRELLKLNEPSPGQQQQRSSRY